MLTDKKSDVCLRIASKTLKCAEITKVLDLEPAKQLMQGEPYSKRHPKKLREKNIWIFKLDLDERVQFEEQLKKIVDVVVGKREALKKLSNCDIDIFCGYTSYNGQGGICLENKIMAKLAELRIDLIFDLYFIDK